MTAAITCTATTRLTHAECLARLAACPALKRGQRPAWSITQWSQRGQERSTTWKRHVADGRLLCEQWTHIAYGDVRDWIAEAAPLRKAREQRQQYRRELSAIASCYTDDPYCQAHCTWHDWPARARKALGIKEEREPYSTEWEDR